MSDFCKQCSIEHFGEDLKELAGLGNGRVLPDGDGWAVICEGCGYIVVNEEGECISAGCEVHGKKLVE